MSLVWLVFRVRLGEHRGCERAGGGGGEGDCGQKGQAVEGKWRALGARRGKE